MSIPPFKVFLLNYILNIMMYIGLKQEIKKIKKKNNKDFCCREKNNINKTTSTSLLNGFPIEKKSYDFANARTISEATNIQNSERFIKNKNNTNSF